MRYIILLLFTWLVPLQIMAQAPLTHREVTALLQKLPREKDKAKKGDLLYQVAIYYLEKNGSIKSDIDSAVQLNRQLIAINKETGRKKNIANTLLLDGKIAVEMDKNDIGVKLKKHALQYAAANNLIKEQANAYSSLADGLASENVDDMIKHYQEAARLYAMCGAIFDQAEVYINMAIGSYYYNRIDHTEKYIAEAIRIKKSIKRFDLYKEFAVLSSVHNVRGEFRVGLEYALKAEKIADREGITDLWQMVIYNYLASFYIDLELYDKAMEYNIKALELAKKTDNKSEIIQLTANINSVLYRQGKFAEALAFVDSELHYRPGKECNVVLSSIYLETHCKLKQYKKARPYYENLLKFKDDGRTYDNDKQTMYHAIALYLLETGQANKSYAYLDKLNNMAKNSDNLLDCAKIELATYKADSATGNYTSAFEHVKRYKALKDSIFNISNTGQLHDLQLKYETEKKDKNIKLLNSKNQLQRIRAENAEKAKNIVLGGIIISLIIIALLFSLYRIKQRSNHKLETHQKELDQKNAFLEMLAASQDKLIKEKEWLVKEVHHRIKNNLQMVTSLLYSQSVYLEDDAAKRAVKDSLRRMQAMALIHQKLYQDENTTTVTMSEYIDELVVYLKESLDTGEQVVFAQFIEPVKLDVSEAIPLGLIITESVVNAIKYAFLNGQSGIVNISLQHDGEDHLLLEISDNGIGLPSHPDLMERNSLGIDLMEGLAKQLNGTFTIKSNNGVHIAVRFMILNKKL